MVVRPYTPEDFVQISQWALEGYSTDYQEHQFPQTGFIVDGVAAYFLYQTDSSVCFLENMIANSKVDKETKDKALDLIVKEILKEAKELGFKVAYATSGNPHVVFRAVMNGATAEGKQVLLTKDLTGPT